LAPRLVAKWLRQRGTATTEALAGYNAGMTKRDYIVVVVSGLFVLAALYIAYIALFM
jgi:hypothetical protein